MLIMLLGLLPGMLHDHRLLLPELNLSPISLILMPSRYLKVGKSDTPPKAVRILLTTQFNLLLGTTLA
jgi:hypothetical protein